MVLSRCVQGTPAGLSSELIEGAIQHAPQPGRHASSGASDTVDDPLRHAPQIGENTA